LKGSKSKRLFYRERLRASKEEIEKFSGLKRADKEGRESGGSVGILNALRGAPATGAVADSPPSTRGAGSGEGSWVLGSKTGLVTVI
jgi:hypothetical protein